jgi:hypothetical protein
VLEAQPRKLLIVRPQDVLSFIVRGHTGPCLNTIRCGMADSSDGPNLIRSAIRNGVPVVAIERGRAAVPPPGPL